jgi:hypothetical protein
MFPICKRTRGKPWPFTSSIVLSSIGLPRADFAVTFHMVLINSEMTSKTSLRSQRPGIASLVRIHSRISVLFLRLIVFCLTLDIPSSKSSLFGD